MEQPTTDRSNRSKFLEKAADEKRLRSVTMKDRKEILQKEIEIALDIRAQFHDQDIFLIPVKLEHCQMPLKLRALQSIDLFRPNGWTTLCEAMRIGNRRRFD